MTKKEKDKIFGAMIEKGFAVSDIYSGEKKQAVKLSDARDILRKHVPSNKVNIWHILIILLSAALVWAAVYIHYFK